MSEFTNKKKSNFDWYSVPFFSHDNGYKLQFNVFANGWDSSGTHMEVYLYLLQGPHDNELTWPLRGQFEVKLLNQISDDEHHVVTDFVFDKFGERVDDAFRSVLWFGPRFISHAALYKVTDTSQFLKDNNVFFQVSKLQGKLTRLIAVVYISS